VLSVKCASSQPFRQWAASVEADMERHLYIGVSERTTLLSLLNRYEDEVIPLHKGSKSEKYRIEHLKKHLGHLRLIITKSFTSKGFSNVET